MLTRVWIKNKLILTIGLSALASSAIAQSPPGSRHPAYLHALSDLQAARWLIEHRPGDWAQSTDEME